MDEQMKQDLCGRISNIIFNYRNLCLNMNHVRRWIDQFEENEQEIMLEGTLHLLERLYLNEERFEQFIGCVCNFIFNQNIINYSILNCQINGGSQNAINQKLRQRIHLDINDNCINDYRKPNLIYLDDFIFTGNRILQDIRGIIDSIQNNTTIYIFVLGWFEYGKYLLSKNLRALAEENEKIIVFNIYCLCAQYQLNNIPPNLNHSDIFSISQNTLDNNRIINEFCNSRLQDNQRLFTRTGNTSRIFTSCAWRDRFEEIAIKYGINIIQRCAHTNEMMKPLGYGSFQPGFGATVFTYRNCPNNTPLIYWWGLMDAMQRENNPALQWYPLLPRETYENG